MNLIKRSNKQALLLREIEIELLLLIYVYLINYNTLIENFI